jgi:rod shape-determining protein MreC
MSVNRDDFTNSMRSALLQKGVRQKFSLFFFICLSILIFSLDSFPSRFMDSSRSILNDSIYRISSLATSPFKLFSFMTEKGKKHFTTYSENEILREKIDILEKKKFDNEFLSAELKDIKEHHASAKSTYDSVVEKVILDKESPFLKSVIINKGSRSKIKKGMPVIARSYLIGRVVEVNYLSSRVLLLNDLNSKISVVIAPSSIQAILSGNNEKYPILEYLPENFVASPDKSIFTSGKDGVISAGIPIGKTLIEEDSDQVKIKLFANPSQLSYVDVILALEQNKEKF